MKSYWCMLNLDSEAYYTIQKLYMFIFKLSFCQITWQIINVPTRGSQVLCTNGDNKFKIPFLHTLFFLQVCVAETGLVLLSLP